MPRLPVVAAAKLMRALERAGFERVRQRESHVRMQHPGGRTVTVPVHSRRDIGRGLLRKILRAELTRDALLALLKWKGGAGGVWNTDDRPWTTR